MVLRTRAEVFLQGSARQLKSYVSSWKDKAASYCLTVIVAAAAPNRLPSGIPGAMYLCSHCLSPDCSQLADLTMEEAREGTQVATENMFKLGGMANFPVRGKPILTSCDPRPHINWLSTSDRKRCSRQDGYTQGRW